ncbi:MAG: putative lipid II flippase FtsW [Acutalibacter sp.]
MAAIGRTARGLRRTPGYRQPEPPRPRRQQPAEGASKRRPMRYKLFSLGAGLDMPLLIFILVLLAIGLVMLFSASYANSYYLQGNSYYYISRQAVFAVFGVAAMLLISTFDYHSFHKLAIVIFGVSLFLLVFLLICRYAHIESIANWEGDATRWLNFGIVSFQPSEIAKFALIVLFAHMISRNLDRMDTFRYGVVPYVAIMGLVAALIFLESHLSATLIILALGAIMMFVGGTKPRWFLIGGVLVAAVLLFVVVTKGGYQMDRIRIWLDPFSSDLDRDLTHQTRQSLYAIGSGGLLGVGLGQSRQKYLYLPAPQNDFIFAIVCEELGFVGALVIIVLFALLIWRGVYVSIHARDKFGMLLGLGITFQVGLQAVLNICVVTNTIPNTGISLPFFSYGGTALLMLLGQMGILLNISRSANVEKT